MPEPDHARNQVDLDKLGRLLDYCPLRYADFKAVLSELRLARAVVDAAAEWVQAEEAPATQPIGPGDYAIQRAGAYVATKRALEAFGQS